MFKQLTHHSGAVPFVLPVLADKADRIDGDTYTDWIFRMPGKKYI